MPFALGSGQGQRGRGLRPAMQDEQFNDAARSARARCAGIVAVAVVKSEVRIPI